MMAKGNKPAVRPAVSTQCGYMLVEMLVSLALVAMLSLGLISGISGGLRIWEASDRSSEALGEAVALESLLRRHLSAAVPVKVMAGKRRVLVYFEGSPDRIRFFTSTEAGVSPKGVYGEELEIRRSGGRLELVIRRSRASLGAFDADALQVWDQASITLSSVEMEFAFYRAGSRGNSGEWSDSWQNQRSIPLLIGLRAAGEDAGRDSPDFVVTPRITTSAIRLGREAIDAYFENLGD